MKKMMKNVFAVLTAFAASAVMTVPVCGFAVDSPTKDVPPAHKLETSAVTASIPIRKQILAFNSENKRIFEPNIVYSYSITSADVTNASISTVDKDGAPVILLVRPGVIGAITAINDLGKAALGDDASVMVTDGEVKKGTITFHSDHDSTHMKRTNKTSDTPYVCNSDYTFEQRMNIVVDASKIYDPDGNGVQDNDPGVYRYKLTDITADETYTASGVTEGTAGDVVYLDVYTKYNEAGNGLLIFGYVLFKETDDGANTSITYNDQTPTETLKIEGFIPDSEGDDNGDGEVIPADFKGDKYITYNVDVRKQVAGDMADRHHEFPFQIVLSNATIKSAPDFSVNDGATHSNTSLDANGAWTSTAFHTVDEAAYAVDPNHKVVDFNLKHGDVISLIGLPASTRVLVKETNDTASNYAVSVTSNGAAKAMVNGNASKTGTSISIGQNDTAAMVEAVAIVLQDSGDQLIVTNTLTDISVTGLLFDIAPFIFMAGAGAILLIVFLRGRKRNDSGNII